MVKPDLVWPESISVPSRPPLLVYLDQLYWINMAKAEVAKNGNVDPYREMLSKCRELSRSGSAKFVLSDVHYKELHKIRNPKQRGDVARIMKELSEFSTILGRTTITSREIDALVAMKCGRAAKSEAVPLIGIGLFHALGAPMKLKIVDKVTGEDRTEETRANIGESKFDEFIESANAYAEGKFLYGPQDGVEIAELQGFGYAPEKMEIVYESRRQRESDLAEFLRKEPKWRKGDPLLRLISANELVHELLDELTRIIMDYDTTMDFLLGGSTGDPLGFSFSMPTIDVVITLRAHYHSQIDKKWETNDVHDIDAMSVAVAYCDVVWTDNEVVDALNRQNLSLRMNTKIGSTPQGFVNLAL